MQYTPRDSRDPDVKLFQSLEPVIRGLGMNLLELNVSRRKGQGQRKPPGVQIRAVVYKDGNISLDDCSGAHRAIAPRLDLAFPDQEIYLEVSSPGIDRLIKDGREFAHFIGRELRCYRTDIMDWYAGVLCAADEKQIVLRSNGEETVLQYEKIAKARLNALPQGTGG